MTRQVLPSAQSALSLVNGESGAVFSVVRDMAMRASLIGVGLYAAGEREALVKKSLYAAGAIEIVVLGFAYMHKKNNG